MSIQNHFSQVLLDGITQLITQLGSKVANEFEFRLGKYKDGHFMSGQNVLQFKNIIENLQHKKYKLVETDSLDISIHDQTTTTNLKSVRLTIPEIANIRKFCMNEKLSDLDSNIITYLKKIKLDQPIDLTDFNLRGQLSDERLIENPELKAEILSVIESPSTKKFYRYKHRYSFTSYESQVRFDLTMIKSNSGLSFKKSNVLNQPENYEIEIEYIGGPVNHLSNPKILTDTMFTDLYDLLKWSQNSDAVIQNSERLAIFNEYTQLIWGTTPQIQESLNYFASANVMPLELHHITPNAQGEFFLKEGYSVTDKADGEHYLLLISQHTDFKGNIYLINNRMEIKHTGLRVENPLLYGCLFDGELVKLKDSNVTKYLLFDCFFWGGKDQRDLPLYTVGSAETNITEITNRYQATIRFIEQLSVEKLSSGINLGFKYKKYLFKTPSSNLSIFQLSQKIYDPTQYPYHLDGLIFTDYNSPYPKASLKHYLKWDKLFKWKKGLQQTIDFMTELIQKNGVDLIKSDFDPVTKQSWKYKEVKLKVGKTIKIKNKLEKQIIPFMPSKYKITDLHITKIKLDDDGEIRTLDGNIIYTGAVVEFSYDEKQPTGYNWIPIRFRDDKTAIKNPNAQATADSVWTLIKEPISENVMTGQAPIDIKNVKLQYYAHNMGILGKLVQPLRDFHNQIKLLQYVNIAKICRGSQKNKRLSLLDLACGQGGDLFKLKEAEISEALLIDHDEDNLTNEDDGAMTRYHKMQEQGYQYPNKVNFIWADSSKAINSGDAGHDTTNKNLLRSILTARGPASFDIVTCQFAIHYMLDSEKSIETLFNNVSLNLIAGGYFMGTTLDGQLIYNQLQTQDLIEGFKNQTQIWKISRQYPINDPFKNVGQQINVFNINIGQDIPEYLVNFDYLVSTAKKFGLELVSDSEIPNLSGLKSFQDLYNQSSQLFKANKIAEIQKMNADEKLYSFMNKSFIFKKVKNTIPLSIPVPVPQPIPQPITSKPIIPIILKKPIGLKSIQPTSTELSTPIEPPVEKKKLLIKKKPTI